MTHHRLTHCPRCSGPVDSVKPYRVPLPEEPVTAREPRMADERVYGMVSLPRTEEWYRYAPCGHVIPPEERAAFVDEALQL